MRPNVVIIQADQFRADCLGAAGHPDVRTPALDSLAADGVRYRNAYSTFPVCTPSRYSLLSGLQVRQHAGWTNRCTLAPGIDTFPRALRRAGYRPAAVGKMHFTPTHLDVGYDSLELAEQDGPGRYDDDYHRELAAAGLAPVTDLVDQEREFRSSAPASYWETYGSGISDLPEEWHSTTWIGERARRSVAGWSPGTSDLLHVSFVKPHHPFDPPAGWADAYDPAALTLLPGWTEEIPPTDERYRRRYFDYGPLTEPILRRVMAHYYATITHLDHQVGLLLDDLRRRGLYDDTLIIFTADHGEYLGFHHLLLKDGPMYDPVIKVPLLIKFPGGRRAGEVGERLVSMIDLAPTVLAACGIDPGKALPGRDLADPAAGHDHVFAEDRRQEKAIMIRSERYKLLWSDAAGESLFDLAADPYEFTDLAADPAHAEALAELREVRARWALHEATPPTYLDTAAPARTAISDRERADRRERFAAAVAASPAGGARTSSAAARPAGPVDRFADRTTVLYGTSDVPSGCYRIPAIIRGADGSLLAFAEHRFHSCADKSDIETVVRRLPPGATEWGPIQAVVRGEPGAPTAPATRGNPGPVVYRKLPGAPEVDAPDGRIVLLGMHNPVDPANPGGNQRTAPRTPYVLHSDDHGATWTAPRLQPQLDDPCWGHYATGPVHAIQLTRGDHRGRLIAGVNYNDDTGSGAMLIFSDDAGITWERGAHAHYTKDQQLIPQEISLVELINGDVLAWARQEWHDGTPEEEADPNVRPHRAIAISRDGGATYHQDYRLVRGYEAPYIQSASLRYGATDTGGAFNRILTMAPSVNTGPRTRPTIRASFDEGLSWQAVDTPGDSTDEGLQVYGSNDRRLSAEEAACNGGYSDLVELADGGLGLLYERGPSDYRSEIAFVRLDPRDLPTPASTPDLPDRSALVFDGVAITSGRFGRAFAFDGERGRVQLPYRTKPVLGPSDFTVSTWFRYDDASRDQALFWAYGLGGSPGVWLRAEPGANRLRGTVTTSSGSATVTSPSAYADGHWHLVVLQRQGGTVTLYVDGALVAEAAVGTGPVSGDDPTPIYLGQRLDGADRFRGVLDDFRIYDRALSGAERETLRTGDADRLGGLTAWLAMDAIVPAPR